VNDVVIYSKKSIREGENFGVSILNVLAIKNHFASIDLNNPFPYSTKLLYIFII